MFLLPGRPLLLIVACLPAACDGEAVASASVPVEAIRARRAARFALADFLKPRMDAPTEIDPYLAPLIYLEAPHEAPVGAPLIDSAGELVVDSDRATVYYTDRIVELEGRKRRQITFVWFRDTRTPRAQGVRLTFDDEGFPGVTEVLADGSGKHLVYVTHELESEAATSFGAPRAGRAFSILAGPSESDDVVLVGTVSGAPAPMGPYLYQARGSNDITTLHCRCSPTQADEIRTVIEYELLPLEMLAGLWPAESQPGFPAADHLTRRLRLPPGF